MFIPFLFIIVVVVGETYVILFKTFSCVVVMGKGDVAGIKIGQLYENPLFPFNISFFGFYLEKHVIRIKDLFHKFRFRHFIVTANLNNKQRKDRHLCIA